MYINGNLGAGADDYSLAVDSAEIANLLRLKVLDHFNNPNNYRLQVDSDAYTEDYGKSSNDGLGWKAYPVADAPGTAGPKSLLADIDGEYGDYYRVPNESIQQWVHKANFGRLSQADITRRIELQANTEVLNYLKGKELSWVASNLPAAINSVVARVHDAINRADSWFAAWGLSV